MLYPFLQRLGTPNGTWQNGAFLSLFGGALQQPSLVFVALMLAES